MSNKRHEKTITRKDGTTIRLVAQYMPCPIGESGTDIFGFVKKPGDEEEKMLFMPRGPRSLNGMSVEEYKTSELRGLLAYLSPGEVLKHCQELQAKLCA